MKRAAPATEPLFLFGALSLAPTWRLSRRTAKAELQAEKRQEQLLSDGTAFGRAEPYHKDTLMS